MAAEAKNEAASLCIGHRMVAVSRNSLANFAEARIHAEEALRWYDPEQHGPLAWRYVHDLGVAAMCHSGIALWHLGFPDQSATMERKAVALATRLNHQNTIGYALFFGGALSAFRRREFLTLREYAERLQAYGREHGLPQWLMWGIFLEAPGLTAIGRPAEAIDRINEGMIMSERMHNRAFRPAFLAALAEAQLAMGEADKALQTVAESLSVAERTREQWMNAELWRLKGAILLSVDVREIAEAEACFQNGIHSARQQGSIMLELRASTSLACLWRDRGKRAEARELLTPVYDWFTEGFDTHDLKTARELLKELEQLSGAT
jgi:predicted ATPase